MNLASGQNHETPPDQAGGRAGLTPDSPIKTWIFDLDNTLYPGGSRVWPQIDLRITLFLSNFFGLDGLSARALQKHYYYRYGTTHADTQWRTWQSKTADDRASEYGNQAAVAAIRGLEGFPRGLYAGAIGWLNARGGGEFFVGLRSALVDGATARVYAGAGIVAGSTPEKEFAETELKFKANSVDTHNSLNSINQRLDLNVNSSDLATANNNLNDSTENGFKFGGCYLCKHANTPKRNCSEGIRTQRRFILYGKWFY